MPFSPENHKLLLKIKKKQADSKIKKFRLNDKNEIIVGDYTSVRETEPMSERKEKERSFVSAAYINNEAQLYDVACVTSVQSTEWTQTKKLFISEKQY